jgi:hypothetical protein
MGTWGPGGPAAGDLEAARAAALEAVARCCSDKDEARKAAAKVGGWVWRAHMHRQACLQG